MRDATRVSSVASISAAVCLALYGAPRPAVAQEAAGGQDQTAVFSGVSLQEVVVTATRRAQTLESVPYSLSVVNSDQLANSGVTDIASLTSQVPGLSIYDLGTRLSGASFPIIRGLNASASALDRPFRTFEQAPVGTYIGNSPIEGYFQLDDIERVEVLRGPQGTLYGAGSLGGALRIIPSAPVLGKFDGNISASGDKLDHSTGTGYDTSAMVNLPVGDTLALRLSGKYDYQPGFVNVYGILERPGSALSGTPTAADPSDPINSSGIFTGRQDWNTQRTFTGRASLLWQPVEQFSATAAFIYGKVTGDGGPTTNPAFTGGAYPLDPTITFPRGGQYEDFSAIDQPYSRRTSLTSLDLSYDVGFATVSSTSSYFETRGMAVTDGTYGCAATDGLIPGYCEYYAGNPISPRFVNPNVYADSTRTFSQELRLVSTAGPDKMFDYTVGLFYQNQHSGGSWSVSEPGIPERSIAQGCTGPYYIGATYPNCQIFAGPNDVNFYQPDEQHFQDRSEFADLTWHVAPQAQITVGGRHFQQSFNDVQAYDLYSFGIVSPPTTHNTTASKNTWKVNPSYEYAKDQYVYALWSQGFRRGGSNALATASLYQDNPSLLSYKPDSVDNYEAGVKGRFNNGVSYGFDVFDDHWHDPQVGGTMPDGNIGVWNAKAARSTGAEFDVSSPLYVSGLTIKASAAYTNARLTQDYVIEADRLGNITGSAGQQLPGSPKTSAAATINYDRSIVSDYDMTLSLNDTYRSAMPLSTFPSLGQARALEVTGMNILNASAAVMHEGWLMGLYVTNLTDKRVIESPGFDLPYVRNLAYEEVINRPREISLRLRYSFGAKRGD
jgi:iron complex outermembrane recepter protein